MKLFRNDKERGCEFDDVCDCKKRYTPPTCYGCIWYRMIDSGYGRCSAFPNAPLVPWCKFICKDYLVAPSAGKEEGGLKK